MKLHGIYFSYLGNKSVKLVLSSKQYLSKMCVFCSYLVANEETKGTDHIENLAFRRCKTEVGQKRRFKNILFKDKTKWICYNFLP